MAAILSNSLVNKFAWVALIVLLGLAGLPALRSVVWSNAAPAAGQPSTPVMTAAPVPSAARPNASLAPGGSSLRALAEAQALVHRRTAAFRQQVTSTLRAELERGMQGFFAHSRRGVDSFLDEQYAILTQLKASWNTIRDTSNLVWEKWNAWWGRKVSTAANGNVQMVRENFETYVLSEASLRAAIARAGEYAEAELQRSTRAFLMTANRELSMSLSRDLALAISPERVADAFQEEVAVAIAAVPSEKTLWRAVVSAVLSEGATSKMTPSVLTRQVATYLTSVWYAQLAGSGKIEAWLGLEAVPSSLAIESDKAGLARIVEQFLWGVVISRFSTEILTRSQAKAKIIAALHALERGLLYGDASSAGLLTIMEGSVDGLCSTLTEAYGRAIRRLVP